MLKNKIGATADPKKRIVERISHPPAISVVIPAYNEEQYIGRCLESIRAQTFTDFEIIVVDNNCTDGTVAIAKKLGARVVREPVQGMIPARNRGFNEARAPIIARTDADSVVSPRWLETIQRTFEGHPSRVAASGPLLSPGGIPDVIFLAVTALYSWTLRILSWHHTLIGPNMAIRTSAWKSVTPHTDDKQVHEDIDLACHLVHVGKIAFTWRMNTHYSLRRWKKRPLYTAAEYSIRTARTLLLHHPSFFHKQASENSKA